MKANRILFPIISIVLLLLIIITLYYLLWKLILEPNPVIREFFDLGPLKSSSSRITATVHGRRSSRDTDVVSNNMGRSTSTIGRTTTTTTIRGIS
jgi:hypothetical protein